MEEQKTGLPEAKSNVYRLLPPPFSNRREATEMPKRVKRITLEEDQIDRTTTIEELQAEVESLEKHVKELVDACEACEIRCDKAKCKDRKIGKKPC